MVSSSSRLATLIANVRERTMDSLTNFALSSIGCPANWRDQEFRKTKGRVLHTHPTVYMAVDEFRREVPTEEPIVILGGVIKRMQTIESVYSRVAPPHWLAPAVLATH
jgi:hypothetical protein